MAGAILIGEKTGVSMSGVEFDHLVEAIRPFFATNSSAIVDEVYSPVDEGGMDFISVQSLSPDAFNSFRSAVLAAFKDELKRNPNSQFQNVWNEVLTKLDSDPRRRVDE